MPPSAFGGVRGATKWSLVIIPCRNDTLAHAKAQLANLARYSIAHGLTLAVRACPPASPSRGHRAPGSGTCAPLGGAARAPWRRRHARSPSAPPQPRPPMPPTRHRPERARACRRQVCTQVDGVRAGHGAGKGASRRKTRTPREPCWPAAAKYGSMGAGSNRLTYLRQAVTRVASPLTVALRL